MSWCFYLQLNLTVTIVKTVKLLKQTTTMKIVTTLANWKFHKTLCTTFVFIKQSLVPKWFCFIILTNDSPTEHDSLTFYYWTWRAVTCFQQMADHEDDIYILAHYILCTLILKRSVECSVLFVNEYLTGWLH